MFVNKELITGYVEQQMNISDLKLKWNNKNVLIVGAGATGLSCANFLSSNDIAYRIVDSRDESTLNNENSNVVYGEFQSHLFTEADILIVSPGVAIKHPLIQQAINQGKEIIGDVELFCRLTKKPIIAITGSNGKSTVTTLVGEILNTQGTTTKVGGNIGVPCLDLLQDDDETDCYVIELSSFQLETTKSLKAFASVILNLSEDHMDRYSSYEDYCSAKKIVLQNAENIIVNLDDEAVVELSQKSDSNKIMFSLSDSHAEFYMQNKMVMNHQKSILDLSNIKLIGEHNKLNILAALSLCSLFDLDLSKTSSLINNFEGLAHRSQVISRYRNAIWVNDSKATNIGATIAALNGIQDSPIYLILGGQSKGQDFNELVPALTKNIKEVIVYGEDAELIIRSIQDKTDIKLTQTDTLENAVKSVNENVIEDDVILFSPACASFDQFDNYMQRGEFYCDVIKGLER